MHPDLTTLTWALPASRSPDLTLRLDPGGVILSTEPAAAQLAGQSLVTGQSFTELFPAARHWIPVDCAAGRLPDRPPRPVTLAETQFIGHLEAQGETLHLRLWEIGPEPVNLPAQLLAAQHALAAATTVDEVSSALLTGLSAAGVARTRLFLPHPLGGALNMDVDTAALQNPAPSVAVNADHPVAGAFRTGDAVRLSRPSTLEFPPFLEALPATRELLALPIWDGKQALGVLLLDLTSSALITDLTCWAGLHLLASSGAVALTRARLFERLRAAGERAHLLLNTTHELVWEADADFQSCGPLAQRQTPMETFPDDRNAPGLLRHLASEMRSRHLKLKGTEQQQACPFSFDLPVTSEDGERVYRQVQAVPVYGPRGNLLSWVGTLADVTARRQMERRQSIIQQVLQQLGSAAEPQELLHAVLHAARAACQGRAAQVVRLAGHDHTVHVLAHQTQDRPGELRDTSFPGDAATLWNALEAGVPTWIAADGTLCPDHFAQRDGAALPAPGSILALPLRTDAGFHVLLLIAGAAAPLCPEVRDHLRWIQPSLGQGAQRALLAWTLQRREEQGRHIINALDEALVLCTEDGTIRQANGPALQLAGLEQVEDLPNIFDPGWHLHDPDGRRLEPSQYPAFTALQTGQAVRDVLVRRHLPGSVQWMSMNAVPWQHDDGRRGVIVSVKDVTEPHLLRQQLELQAQQDELTGLPNRRMFNQAVQALNTRREGGAVLLLDLDRFKLVNDTYGHHIGDALLQVIARRLQHQVQDGLCSRLAGDEFGVVLPGVTAQAARELVSHLLPLLEQPVSLRGVTLHPQVSIGLCATTDPDWEADAWFKGADLALHDAKQQGRSRWSEYTDVLERQHARRVAIEERLRLTLQSGGLTVEYQPIERQGQPGWLDVEALARWEDAELGCVSPTEFIPVAEEAGLMTLLGEQVLRAALTQVHDWSQVTGHPVRVHVNVSGGEMKNPDFARRVSRILRETGCEPAQLITELTESEAVGDVQPVLRQLNALQALGVRIALDDFGTGHSSLSMLEQLPVDSVKIDRSFVQNVDATPRRRSLLSAMLRMGEELGVQVIVEGVETAVERQVLDTLGVQFVQGYQVSRPVPATGLSAGPHGLTLAPVARPLARNSRNV